MNLYIIRHAEPDYALDSLTPKGWREAQLLAKRLVKIEDPHFYVSPLGRAQDTASFTLKALGATAETLPWLEEFRGRTVQPETSGAGSKLAWDRYPRAWKDDPLCYDRDNWTQSPLYLGGNCEAESRLVAEGLDTLLAQYGYVRDGSLYRVERPNRENIVLFCHFGVTCVMLGHLMGVSPLVLWHHTVTLPSSVTLLSTEEREQGWAVFRMSRLGDLSHLETEQEPPSFAARFCETFESDDRH